MDRDNNWGLIVEGYHALVEGEAEHYFTIRSTEDEQTIFNQ